MYCGIAHVGFFWGEKSALAGIFVVSFILQAAIMADGMTLPSRRKKIRSMNTMYVADVRGKIT